MSRPARAFRTDTRFMPDLKKSVPIQTIQCCKCPNQDFVPIVGRKGLPPEVLNKKFSQKGWKIGGSRNADICPDCLAARKAARTECADTTHDAAPDAPLPVAITIVAAAAPALVCDPVINEPTEPDMSNVTVLHAEPSKPDSTKSEPAKSEPKADAPRTPTRDDRRRIMARLEVDYDAERKCYCGAATDKTIAADLKMPWAWIAQIRDEFFGPEGNEETYAMIEGLEEVRAEIKALKERVIQARSDAAAKIAVYRQQIDAELESVITHCNAEVERVDTRLKKFEASLNNALKRL